MKVAVIMGGISSEREISLKSGMAVYDGIDKNKYDLLIFDLNKGVAPSQTI